MPRLAVMGLCLAAAIASLAAIPARAEPPLQPGEQTLQAPPDSDTADDPRERRALREERLQLRTEHESLEAEHDRLKTACIDAKGQERTDCDQKKEALRDRMDDWHKRHKAFEEQVAAEYHETAAQPTNANGPHP